MNSIERQHLAQLIRKLCILSAPCVLMIVLAIVVDPYNLNSYLTLPLEKGQIASIYNERLWKLNQFAQHPSEYILIGDSRAQRIQAEQLTTLSNKPWHCIALSGATLAELIDTFWFATQHSSLKEIMFCINFDRFNDWQTASGVHHAQELIEYPLRAYIAPETWKATLHTIAHTLYTGNGNHQKPPVSKELFWQEQLRDGKQRYQRFVAPVYVQKELEKISAYCNEHAIQLTFVVLPTHVEFQQLIQLTQLDTEYMHFKQLLTNLGNVCDLDQPNEFTCNAEYFSDPWHANWNTNERLAKMILHNEELYVCSTQ